MLSENWKHEIMDFSNYLALLTLFATVISVVVVISQYLPTRPEMLTQVGGCRRNAWVVSPKSAAKPKVERQEL